jgi:hypothetical protein
LDVTYDNGEISAVGTPPEGIDWEILSFTGSVTERGRAEGTAIVWFFHEGRRETIDFPLTLSLNTGTTCAERNTLHYSFSCPVETLDLTISGDFRGTREAD